MVWIEITRSHDKNKRIELFKGIKYIYQIFAIFKGFLIWRISLSNVNHFHLCFLVVANEHEMEIRHPTNIRHVALVGWGSDEFRDVAERS